MNRVVALLGLVGLWIAFALPAAAQSSASLAALERNAATWETYLDWFEPQVEGGPRQPGALRHMQPVLQSIEQEARAAREEAAKRIDRLQAINDALGPAPAEGEPPEDAGARQQRADVARELAAWRARAADAEVALTRVGRLQLQVATSRRAVLQDRLAARQPLPVAPGTWRLGLPPLLERIGELASESLAWLTRVASEPAILQRLPLPLLLFGALLFGGRHMLGRLRRRFGRQSGRPVGEEGIPYPRRLLAALVDGLATFVYPALFCAAVWFWLQNEDRLASERVLALAEHALVAVYVFLAGWALPRALIMPDAPDWRLAPIPAHAARALSARIGLLAAILAVDVFCVRAELLDDLPAESVSLFLTVMVGLLTAGILLCLAPSLWHADEDQAAAPGDGNPADEEAAAGTPEREGPDLFARFWSLVAGAVRIAAIAAIVGLLVGYVRLAEHVVHVLLFGGLAIVMLFVLRGLLRYAIGAAMRAGPTQRFLFRHHRTRNRVKFWLRVVLDLVGLLAAVLLIALIAGVAPAELQQIVHRLLTGFEIGTTTIRPIDTLFGLLIFALALTLTRTGQRALSQRLLPRTQLDPGVQNSIAAGLGYAGFALAVMLGVATMGLDLTNIALIAGALSVGIGFGLQNVVNNFVSGMILLIERPVKVGDWVVVGSNEGFVKQINVRATELQTFQRASVIIPNAELISSAVINWTHKDRHARTEIPVGVAYGSDVAKVRQILLDAATRHADVLDTPPPFVLFIDFADSALLFELRCFTADATRRLHIASDLRFEIDRVFREEGIEIPFPQRVVHQAKPSRPDPRESDPGESDPGIPGDAAEGPLSDR